MSLKAFHIVFIFASLVLAVGFGAWGVHDYRTTGSRTNLWMGIGSLVVAVAIVPYSFWFLRKTRKESYL